MTRVYLMAALLLLLLAGCSRGTKIQVQADEPATATVEVCGKVTPLSPNTQGSFSGRREITCKGSGLLRVTFANGAEVTCPIDSSKASEEEWFFMASQTGCRVFAKPKS